MQQKRKLKSLNGGGILHAIPSLRGVGGTLFDLNALQDEYHAERGSVLELDFYHAAPLLPISDEAFVQRALSVYLPPCSPVGLGCG